MSRITSINESILIATRHPDPKTSTRIISLDPMPVHEGETASLHERLLDIADGPIDDGWGEVSQWPAERISRGDRTAAIWRSPELAEAAARLAEDRLRLSIEQLGLQVARTERVLGSEYVDTIPGGVGSVSVVNSKDADGQTRIRARPDTHRLRRPESSGNQQTDLEIPTERDQLRENAGLLLITAGQRNNTARLTAVASEDKHIGGGWMLVADLGVREAKATAVFLNSTAGRLQPLRNMGRTRESPLCRAAGLKNIRIPDLSERGVMGALADCWKLTKDEVVLEFRDGECELR